MDADLKPCPFCGENAAEANQETGDAGLVRHSIYCTVCMAEGPTTYRPDRAIERWNERAAGVALPLKGQPE